jgi:hypothetical protein
VFSVLLAEFVDALSVGDAEAYGGLVVSVNTLMISAMFGGQSMGAVIWQ